MKFTKRSISKMLDEWINELKGGEKNMIIAKVRAQIGKTPVMLVTIPKDSGIKIGDYVNLTVVDVE